MQVSSIKDFLISKGISNSFLEELTKAFVEVEYPRNFILYKEGKLVRKIWIVKKGLIGYFFHSKDKEHLAWIDQEGDLIGSVRSIGMGLTASETCVLLENSELLEIDFESLSSQELVPLDLEKFKNAIFQYYFIAMEDRLKIFQSMDAKARYIHLMNHRPQLLQRVSLQQIASFLGITPETLSRIRSEIS